MSPTDPHPPNAPAGHGQLPHGAPPQPDPRTAAGGGYDDGVPHHTPGEHDELHNEDVAHEHSDVDVRAIGTSAGIVAGVVAVSMLAMYLLFGWFERHALRNQPDISHLASPATEMPPTTAGSPVFNEAVSGVPLLTNEPMALERQRAVERQRLERYGWVDEQTGAAHIPIEEAKKLILERGLPVREFEAVEPTLGTRLHATGEASGGRIITGGLPDADAAGEPPGDDPAPQPPPAPQGSDGR